MEKYAICLLEFLAGIGLHSTAHLSLPCFLSSSHACMGLVNRQFPLLTWNSLMEM